jgi:hypothetical protein
VPVSWKAAPLEIVPFELPRPPASLKNRKLLRPPKPKYSEELRMIASLQIVTSQLPRPPEPKPLDEGILLALTDTCKTAPLEIALFETPRPPEPHELALLRSLLVELVPDTWKTAPCEITSLELPRPPEHQEPVKIAGDPKIAPMKIATFQSPRPPEPVPHEVAMLCWLLVLLVYENWKTASCGVAIFELPRPPEPYEVALLRLLLFVDMPDTWKNVLSEIVFSELPRPPEPYFVSGMSKAIFGVGDYSKAEKYIDILFKNDLIKKCEITNTSGEERTCLI